MNNTKENLKSALLFLLIVSTVFLVYMLWIFDTPLGEFSFSEMLFNPPTLPRSDTEGISVIQNPQEVYVSKPMKIMLQTEKGMHGVAYSDSEIDKAYVATLPLISQAWQNASSPTRANENEYLDALKGKGILYDYDGLVSPETVSLWFGIDTFPTFTQSFRYLFLYYNGNGYTLYCKDPQSGLITKAQTSSAPFRFDSFEPNHIILGINSNYKSVVTPESFIVNEKLYTVNYANETLPISDLAPIFARTFKMNPNAGKKYTESDGSEVFVNDTCTLHVSKEGEISYNNLSMQNEGVGYLISSNYDTPTEKEIILSLGSLILSLSSNVSNPPKYYLTSIKYEGALTTVTFGVQKNSVPIDLPEECSFTLNGRLLQSARFTIKNYVPGESMEQISGDLAALMAKTDKPRELCVRYTNGINLNISAGWVMGVR